MLTLDWGSMANLDIDWEQILKSLGGDQDLLREVLQLSLTVIPRQTEKLRLAVESRLARDIELTAHNLKGSLTIYHNQPLLSLAMRLETEARSGCTSNSEQIFRDLEIQISYLLKTISAKMEGKRAS